MNKTKCLIQATHFTTIFQDKYEERILDLAATHTLHVYHFAVILVKDCLTMMLVLAVSTCAQKFTRAL